MNLVERDPLAELIPLCQKRGVGVTIMKPVATGLLPAPLALKWLLNQPIASAVPGATTVDGATWCTCRPTLAGTHTAVRLPWAN